MTRPSASPAPRPLVLRLLREIYGGPAWHGPSLQTALRGVSAPVAARRVAPGRNTIWDIVLHLAYTRHRMIQRLGVRTERFPRPLRAAWWPRMPARLTPAAWRDDIALLSDYQEQLLAAVRKASTTRLHRQRPGQPRTIADELLNVAVHDGYHAGQIQLLRRVLER
jgi:hypothetical protein